MIDQASPATSAGKATSAPSYSPRIVGFTTPRQICCPRGHHLRRETVVLDDAVLMCKHREPLKHGEKGGAAECGKLLYVCLGWQARGSADAAVVFVAEVSYKEAEEMQRRRLDLDGVLKYLGVQFPVTALAPV